MYQPRPTSARRHPRRFVWRRLVQYRLRTLLIVTTLVAVGLGWWSYSARRQRETVAALQRAKAHVSYDFHQGPEYRPSKLASWVGVDFFADVVGVSDLPHDTSNVDLDRYLNGLTRLEMLHLTDTQISDAALARLSKLTRLTILSLDNTPVTDAGLVHVQGLTNLEGLYLKGTHLTDAGLEHLRSLTGLQRLDLENTQVTVAGVVRLQKALPMCVIESFAATLLEPDAYDIDLADVSQLTDGDLEYLKGNTSLGYLNLSGTRVTDAGLVHLNGLSALKSLALARTEVSDATLRRVAGLEALESLGLPETQITDAGLKHLKGLKALKELSLDDTRVTDAGLEHLKGFSALKYLYLTGTLVTDEGVAHLRKALPDCEIQR